MGKIHFSLIISKQARTWKLPVKDVIKSVQSMPGLLQIASRSLAAASLFITKYVMSVQVSLILHPVYFLGRRKFHAYAWYYKIENCSCFLTLLDQIHRHLTSTSPVKQWKNRRKINLFNDKEKWGLHLAKKDS